MHKMFELASAKSLWYGVDYYKKRKVIHYEKIGESSEYSYGMGRVDCVTYAGLVRGKSPSSEDDRNYIFSEDEPVLSPEEAKAYNKPDAPVYHVTINTGKVKKSTCDCAFAKGRYVICKPLTTT